MSAEGKKVAHRGAPFDDHRLPPAKHHPDQVIIPGNGSQRRRAGTRVCPLDNGRAALMDRRDRAHRCRSVTARVPLTDQRAVQTPRRLELFLGVAELAAQVALRDEELLDLGAQLVDGCGSAAVFRVLGGDLVAERSRQARLQLADLVLRLAGLVLGGFRLDPERRGAQRRLAAQPGNEP